MNILDNILSQYDISESKPFKMLRQSGDNLVYLVGVSDKKILRISRKLAAPDVTFEYDVVRYLFVNGFPVPKWIKTKTGGLYAFNKETEIAVMFGFLDGYHAIADQYSLPTKAQAYSAGRALGSISKVAQMFKSSSPRGRNIYTELKRVLQNELNFRKDFEGGAAFIEEVKQAIRFGDENRGEIGLIHNDFRVGNVFFKNGDDIGGVIDFDWCCIGPYIKDLALGVMEWSFPDGRIEPDDIIFDEFLDGYNSVSVRKFSKDKYLYSWMAFAALSDAATYFCDRLGNPELKREMGHSYMYRKYLYFSKMIKLA